MSKRKFNVSMDIINVKKHKSNFDDISEDDYKAIREKAYELCEDNANKAIEKINDAIIRTDSSDDYSVGLRNGMRLAISCITGEEPKFEHTYMKGKEE